MDDTTRGRSHRRELQEAQYREPYHYLPRVDGKGFRQYRYWSWGYRYLGRLQVVFDLLDGMEFHSLLDVGCGDGRFLQEMKKRHGRVRLQGMDISPRAVRLARMMNPELDFQVLDVTDSTPRSTWNVVTLLEVIEHIPPPQLPEFLERVVSWLRPDGFLVITVPHSNEPVAAKHYQHFDSDKLRELLDCGLEELRCVPFDYPSLFLRIFSKILGGEGRVFIVTQPVLVTFFFNYYMKHCLYGSGEKSCRRMAMLLRKKPESLDGSA